MDTTEALIAAIASLVSALAAYLLRPKVDKALATHRAKKASETPPSSPS